MYISIEVPEICEYPQGFPKYWLKSMFIGTVSQNYQVNALVGTYIRLVEAALVEYQLGTSMLQKFWGTHTSINLRAMYRSISHFESCLLDMHRAINCYRRLRRHKDQHPLCLALNIEKPSFAADPVADQLRLIRNEIYHLDEAVIDGRVQEGQPFALKPDGPETPHPIELNQTIKSIDRLIIGQRELLFSSLAEWLTEMGRYAEKIADFGPDRKAGSATSGTD
ncbi:MAG TPA: hypothetical protein P5149_03745 [Candidatus Competibacteraceae bacterium]|nr:hypothetical protein [Candidatus Competibacteraceae bacterium]MCP5132684.1 hypothetical protein [Gammaproteobacteria bacterium]HPF59719.1 hypothetical protein [Candidatus Competibacteraceae bacterium]HRY17495.1 hypothetical protein [Candidatus Competibacteraceae bacterium]